MTARLPPLPLTDAAGRIFAYACAHCLEVGSIPGIGGGTLDSNREARAKASLRDAEHCGECGDCKTFDADHTERRLTCRACVTALKARQPKGAMVRCPHCKGKRTVEAIVGGIPRDIDCPECEGDGDVWQPEAV